jgi:hypothetical protein
MHIDHPNWLGMFKEQEELAAQQPIQEAAPIEEPKPTIETPDEPTPPRLRLVPPPE